MFGARHADVHQAALFLDSIFRDRPTMRQDALFDSDQKYASKLQALCRVQSHQGDGVARIIIFVFTVALIQRELFQKISECGFLSFTLIVFGEV